MSDKKTNTVSKLKNTVALKRTVYAVVLSVIFIAAVILLNVLATAIARKYPLELDLTSNKIHTMSDENIDYIKNIDKDIKLYVCLSKEQYDCTSSSNNMAYYAAQTYYVNYSTANAEYFKQTVELLDKYTRYNDHISIEYIDLSQPYAEEITSKFSELSFYYGDILVESTFKVDGKDKTRRTVINFSDMYTTKEGSNYYEMYVNAVPAQAAFKGYAYDITENNVEISVSSAIYKVTSEKTPAFVVPKMYCDTEYISSTLEETLTRNNYTVEYADGTLSTLLNAESYDKYDGIIICDPLNDITTADREALEAFLDNGGKKQKLFLFFAGIQSYKYTTLCSFLSDWGIGIDSGLLYETDKSYVISEIPTQMLLKSMKTDYTKSSDRSYQYVASNFVPMHQLYENNITSTYDRNSKVLMRTGSNGTVAVMPSGEKVTEWTVPSGSESTYDAYPTAILTEDVDTDEDDEYISSFVVAFASSEMLSNEWNQYDAVGNINFTLDVVNYGTGSTDVPFSFVAKTITEESYQANVTASKVTAIKWIFMGLLPVSCVGIGVFIWIRRKRK